MKKQEQPIAAEQKNLPVINPNAAGEDVRNLASDEDVERWQSAIACVFNIDSISSSVKSLS
ncbi:MAG: hypothetical protein KME59_23080 [Trichormus sp. ATA11-4-KO1]|nr:hypothetical protein [Trichormus sp. ATA11-4-KO1]